MALPRGPIFHFERAGYQVISYDYPLAITTHSPAHTIRSLEAVLADASHKLGSIPPDMPVAAWGTSLGTALAARFAADNPRVRKVMLNLSYGDIAEHIIHLPFMWLVPPKRRNRFIQAAGGAEGLHSLFDDYSPLHLAPRLGDKHILLYLARNDRIQKWEHTAALPDALRHAGAELTFHENRLSGHYFGCLYNHLNAHRYMDFLSGQRQP